VGERLRSDALREYDRNDLGRCLCLKEVAVPVPSASMHESDVDLRLDGDEALVLHDWLSRFNGSNPTFDDQAEQRVLWNLEARLEAKLVAPFMASYPETLAAARDRLRDVEL
jgi:hypothetical protein